MALDYLPSHKGLNYNLTYLGTPNLLLLYQLIIIALEQSIDFKNESSLLYDLLKSKNDDIFNSKTQFKSWTINDVLYHLHVWNNAAFLSLTNEKKFSKFMKDFFTAIKSGHSARSHEKELSNNISGQNLLMEWKKDYEKISEEFLNADPKKRVKWAGPDMSVRSSITARHMETWSHGQEIYDQLGVIRNDADHIKNIVIIGINTFGWTFMNRSLEVPNEQPKLILESPSNKTWEWNSNNKKDSIIGKASEFCQVVTQVRNIKDTNLIVNGDIAKKWMSIAQCFAGPPEDPPKKGSRFTKGEKNG